MTSPSTHPLLSVREVTRSYGDRLALDAVDLEVAAGEVCGLLGPNGAGKTTLVSIIAGLIPADRGAVHVAGRNVASDRRTRGLVGLATQEIGVYPTLDVAENLELMAGVAGLRRRDASPRIAEVASILELDGLLDRRAGELSGGERRRLHTAMAMLNRPRLLLLDEPTAGVDILTRSRLLRSIRELAAHDGCAVLYSTHYLPEIEELEATVAILDHGHLLARGSARDIVAEHGIGMVELTFGAPPPAQALRAALHGRAHTVDGRCVSVPTDQPDTDATAIRGNIEHLDVRLEALSVVQPNLESAFHTLAGGSSSEDRAENPRSWPERSDR